MYKHILLATDLTEASADATKKAKHLADLFQADLSIVHSIEPIPAYGYPMIEDLESPRIDHAEAEMAKLGDELNVPKDNQKVLFGPTKNKIIEAAKECNADLIVLGSHGRHGLALLLGSTANAIIHHADCDVIVVRVAE